MTRTFDRTGTGAGRGKTYVENPLKDLPPGLPAAATPTGDERPLARNPHGQFADRQAASEAGKRGAAKRLQNRLMTAGFKFPKSLRVGEGQLYEVRDSAKRFAELADKAVTEKCTELARDVGGNYCGVGPTACIKAWAHAHFNSLMLFELAGGPLGAVRQPGGAGAEVTIKLQQELLATAARLSAEARQSLLTAHSLCASEAEARAKRVDPSSGAPPGFVFVDDGGPA